MRTVSDPLSGGSHARRSLAVDDLEVVVAVANEGSLGAAARAMGITQPAVSARMHALQRRLGCDLFISSARGTTLTRSGRALRRRAEWILEMLDEAEAYARNEVREAVVVATPASLTSPIFGFLLGRVTDGSVDFIGRVAHSDEAQEAVIRGSADVAFVFTPPSSSELVVVGVARSPIVLAARADVVSLRGQRVIVHNWGPEAAHLERHAYRRGAEAVHLVGAPDAAVDLAVSKGAVAAVPAYTVRELVLGGELVLLTEDLHGIGVEILALTRTPGAPGVRDILALIPELAEERLGSSWLTV